MRVKRVLVVLVTAMATLAPAADAQASDLSCGRNLWPYSFPGTNDWVAKRSGPSGYGWVHLYRKLTNQYGWIYWVWGDQLSAGDTVSLDWTYKGEVKNCHATVGGGYDSVTSQAVNEGTEGRYFRGCVKTTAWDCTPWGNSTDPGPGWDLD
ncbi:hypothetical protein [Nonomuraea sp. NPDC002799]